jgi:chloramphenicol O-acetyltransferase
MAKRKVVSKKKVLAPSVEDGNFMIMNESGYIHQWAEDLEDAKQIAKNILKQDEEDEVYILEAVPVLKMTIIKPIYKEEKI